MREVPYPPWREAKPAHCGCVDDGENKSHLLSQGFEIQTFGEFVSTVAAERGGVSEAVWDAQVRGHDAQSSSDPTCTATPSGRMLWSPAGSSWAHADRVLSP